MSDDSISQWLDGIQEGDADAAQKLWEIYYQKLTGLARQKLRASNRRASDEEDLALSAFFSFCQNAADGRFPVLNDRDDLWRILFTIVDRKSMAYIRKERRQKRGGGDVRGESVFLKEDGAGMGLDQAKHSPEPTAESACQIAEEMHNLLAKLDEQVLRDIAVAKLEGYTNAEIAERIGCSERTVKRKLSVIRTVWQACTSWRDIEGE